MIFSGILFPFLSVSYTGMVCRDTHKITLLLCRKFLDFVYVLAQLHSVSF